METELACAVDLVMTQAKRIYILIIKVNKLFSFFSWSPQNADHADRVLFFLFLVLHLLLTRLCFGSGHINQCSIIYRSVCYAQAMLVQYANVDVL